MKKIGIVGWRTGDNSFGVTLPYLQFASKYGKAEIITPAKEDDIRDLDLLILPGGMDVNPSNYGEVPGYFTSHTDVYKQFFLDNNLSNYINAGIPVFGICLGLQQLNVFFGGSLEQDYANNASGRNDEAESITVNLAQVNKSLNLSLKQDYFKDMKVNSMHHQAVTNDKLAPDLKVLAISNAYRNVEAFIHNELRVAAVQWHPEELRMNCGDKLTSLILNNWLQ